MQYSLAFDIDEIRMFGRQDGPSHLYRNSKGKLLKRYFFTGVSTGLGYTVMKVKLNIRLKAYRRIGDDVVLEWAEVNEIDPDDMSEEEELMFIMRFSEC